MSDQLASFEHDGRTFWHAPADGPTAPGSPTGHLLQILDETYRGYQDSRWVLDASRTRETAAGMALVDTQLVAAMKRAVTADRVQFELRAYRPLRADEVDVLEAAAGRYGSSSDVPQRSNCAERGPIATMISGCGGGRGGDGLSSSADRRRDPRRNGGAKSRGGRGSL